MQRIPSLLIRLARVREDPALQPGGRGLRKIVVTHVREHDEQEAQEAEWRPPDAGHKSPVQHMVDAEVSYFNEQAPQTRHRHGHGTEAYVVLRGALQIEVEGERYELSEGDAIIVNPLAAHEVIPTGGGLLACVITLNCGGSSDKHEVPKS